MKKILIYLILTICFIISASHVFANTNQAAIDSGISYLKTQQQTDGSISGFSGVTQWASQAFSADNIDITTVASAGGQNLENYMENNPPTSSSTVSDWSRDILTITAANENPYSFGGTDYVANLETYYNNSQLGDTSADNDDSFGLMALLAANQPITQPIMTDTLSFILAHEHSDGGFSYSTDPTIGSDIDDTAAMLMALQVAKTHGMTNPNLQTSIDSAAQYITSHQNSDGGFAYDPNPATSYDTTSNVSTTSWVVMALNALGLGNSTATTNATNYIVSSQQPDGSFPYQAIYPPGDTFDSSYALLALTNAYWPIHTFAGTVPVENPVTSPTVTPTPTSDSNDSSSNPTPTPTPTNNSGSSTPTPTPTSTPLATSTPQPSDQSVVTTNTPSPTEVISEPTQAVLGATTNTLQNKQTKSTGNVLAEVFAGIGVIFLIGYGFQLYIKSKKKITS